MLSKEDNTELKEIKEEIKELEKQRKEVERKDIKRGKLFGDPYIVLD